MDFEKQRARLEIAYDIMAKVHSDICSISNRSEKYNLTDDTMEILRSILGLRAKLNEMG